MKKIHPIVFFIHGLSIGLVMFCFHLFLPITYIPAVGIMAITGVSLFFQQSRLTGWKRLVPFCYSISCIIVSSFIWQLFISKSVLAYPAFYIPLGIIMVYVGYYFSYGLHILLQFVPSYKMLFDVD
jgi:hypothetical protein